MTQQNVTFWGVGTWGGACDSQIELERALCTMHLATKFYHPMFNRSEVIVLTNKQTNRYDEFCCYPYLWHHDGSLAAYSWE